MRSILLLIFLATLWSCNNNAGDQFANTSDQAPNILLIVADDLGYGDLGCFGSEIQTPTIDSLAKAGIVFTRFQSSPMCAPTRAMLLTGNDNHIAGMGAQSVVTDHFGYEGHLTNRVLTIPELLRQGGYHTYMAGKWHLGMQPEHQPFSKGFEKSFALLEGAGNHYRNRSVLSAENSHYVENNQAVEWPDGKYSTEFYTDKLISYIDADKKDGQPFFAYAAFTSPHWPLQVDSSYWLKYEQAYEDGYETLRIKRFAQLKKNGFITNDSELPDLLKPLTPWDSLEDQQQKIEIRKMALYAGMVENLDTQIRRLMRYLTKEGLIDNTLVIFMSDNGAAYRDFYLTYPNAEEVFSDYDNSYNNMGSETSYVSYGPQWAEAGSVPFRYYKDFATEGGMNTTLIMSSKHIKKKSEWSSTFVTLLDIAPTLYEIAGITYPDTFNERMRYPLRGESMLSYLNDEKDHIHDSTYVFALEHAGNAMLRKGDWKLTNVEKPFKIENFGLYNLKSDLAEKYDLREEYPEKYQELLSEWTIFSEDIKDIHPTPGSGH